MMPQRGMLGRGSNEAHFGGPRRLDDVSEIIDFVRNYQTGGLQRESTEMRLSRKAPLPDIGHSTDYVVNHQVDSPRGQFNRHLLNNNLLNSHVIEEDAAYESDAEGEIDIDPAPYGVIHTHSPPMGIVRQQTMYGLPQNANRLSRSVESVPEHQNSRLHPIGKQRKYPSEPGRSKAKAVHHLPPMEPDLPDRPTAPRPMSGRGDRPRSALGNRPRSGQARPKSGYGRRRELPSRPSAPSPSLTPPPGDAPHIDPDGDPIDFIDCSN